MLQLLSFESNMCFYGFRYSGIGAGVTGIRYFYITYMAEDPRQILTRLHFNNSFITPFFLQQEEFSVTKKHKHFLQNSTLVALITE